jgi:two-component system nitrogen regulation sensor histidine kinase NtrY
VYKKLGVALLLLLGILLVGYFGVSLLSSISGEFYLNNPLFHLLMAFILIVITVLFVFFIRNLAIFFLPHFRTNLRVKIFTAFLLLVLGPALFSIFWASGVINQGLDRLLRIQIKRIVSTSYETTEEFLGFLERDLKRKTQQLSYRKVYPYTLKAYGIDGFFRKEGKREMLVGRFPLSSDEIKKISGLKEFSYLDKSSKMFIYCLKKKSLFVCVSKRLPDKLAQNILKIKELHSSYETLTAYKTPIKTIYTVTFGIMGLAVLFGALWFAKYFESRISIPIDALYKATEKISEGNLDIRIPEEEATGELKHVITAFNSMVSQLKALKKNLEENRKYLEEILNAISPAIITFDFSGRVVSCNNEAKKLFKLSGRVRGRNIMEVLDEYPNLKKEVEKLLKEEKSKGEVREEIGGKEKFLTLEIIISPEVGDRILIIEDVSDLVRAKKAEAWREVAQRIAHEIKNPLTPITLNAERIKRLYEKGRLSEENLNKIVKSILEEVEVIRRLIDEFRKFARLPLPEKRLTDINQLIKQTLEPYQNRVEVEYELEELPKIPVDRGLIREVLINLIDNSISAGATKVRVSTTEKGGKVFVVFRDNGPGIPDEIAEKLFNPYVTTKEEGWGLGLSIVKKIISDHGGKIYTVDKNTFVIELPM